MKLIDAIIWFFMYSFAGWLWEVIYTAVVERKVVNRGFFIGPLCPIYGAGALVAVYILQPISNPAMQFLFAGTLATLLEYATSWVLERVFGARWWDYSNFRFNLDGRVCLPASLAFASMMLLLNLVIHPALSAVTGRVPASLRVVLCVVLVILFLSDVVFTIANMYGFNKKLETVQGYLQGLGSGMRERTQESARSLAAQARAHFEERTTLYERKVARDSMFEPTRFSKAYDVLKDRFLGGDIPDAPDGEEQK